MSPDLLFGLGCIVAGLVGMAFGRGK